MRSLIALSLFILLLGLSACKTDFEVNEPWKEIDIVYGLLDVNDSVQYIKINKAFLNENEDVYKLAGIEDTLFHKDSLHVTLQPLQNGAPSGSEITLRKTYVANKDSGLFSYPGQYIYETPSGFQPDVNSTYRLTVKNTVTGNTAKAESPVIKNVVLISPGSSATNLNFKNNPSSKYSVEFRSGKGARFYDLTLVFHYEEYRKKDSVKIKNGTITWPVFSSLYSNPESESNLRYVINGPDFFRVVAQALEINGDVYRIVPSKAFEFRLSGGGEEIYNYMQVNRPSIGIVQKKPEYTNIENGYGIFSTRNRIVLYLDAGPLLKGDLKVGDMGAYNFR
jgi:hypothetical protein